MAFDGTLKFDTAIDKSGFEAGLEAIGKLAKSGFAIIENAIKSTMNAMVGFSTALVDEVSGIASYGDNIDKMSQKLGMSASAYQEWDAVMQHCGTSIDSMQSGMKTLASAAETNADAFQILGISQEQLASMSQEELFSATITALQNIDDETQRTYLASKLLGKGATELGALLNTSAEDVEKMKQTVHELGGVMSDEAVSASAVFQDSLQDMKTALAGLSRNILSEFMPSMSAVMDGITEILSGNLESGLNKLKEGVSGVIENINNILPEIINMTDILPELVSAGVSIVQSIASAIFQNSDKIVEAAMEIGMTLINGLYEILPYLPNIASDVITTLMKSITAHKKELIKAATDLIKRFSAIIADNASELMYVGAEMISALISGIAESLPELIETAIELITELSQAVIDNFPIIADAVIEALPVVLDALLDNLPLIIQTIMTVGIQVIQYIPKIFDQIVMMLPDLIGQIVAALIDNAPAIWEAFVALFSEAVLALDEVWNSLVAALSEAVMKIAEYFSIGFSDIKKFFSDVYSEIKEEISKTWSAVKKWGADMVNTAVKTAQDFFDNIVNFFVKIPTKVKESLSDTFDKVADWGGNIISKIIDIGKNLVKGIWNGIQNMKQWIKERILSFGDVILDSFKSVFGIHSPSAVMRDSVGKYLAQGIGVGFSEEIPEVGKNALKAFESLKFASPEIGFKAVPEIDSSALSAVNRQNLSIDSSFVQPDISSVVNNSYTYNNSSASLENPQEIVINAQFCVGEEVVASGVKNILLSEADKQQGINIQLKKRGLTT